MSRSLLVLALLSLTSLFSMGCSKDKKDDGDAAAEAAAPADDAAADAAVADAAVADAADAATTPLTTAVPIRPKPVVAPPDPPICVSARAAKARNNPAAAGLAAQCAAAGGKL